MRIKRIHERVKHAERTYMLKVYSNLTKVLMYVIHQRRIALLDCTKGADNLLRKTYALWYNASVVAKNINLTRMKYYYAY
jgi:hypothetical protein